MKQIDARGLSCPQPVVLVKKALEAGDADLEIRLDSEVSRENVSRLLTKQGIPFEVRPEGDEFLVTVKG